MGAARHGSSAEGDAAVERSITQAGDVSGHGSGQQPIAAVVVAAGRLDSAIGTSEA